MLLREAPTIRPHRPRKSPPSTPRTSAAPMPPVVVDDATDLVGDLPAERRTRRARGGGRHRVERRARLAIADAARRGTVVRRLLARGAGIRLGLLRRRLCGGVARLLLGRRGTRLVALGGQHLFLRLAIDQLVVAIADRIGADQHLALVGGHRPDPARGRLDQHALHRRRRAIGLEQRHQSLTDLEFGDRGRDVEAGIGAEGLGGGAHRRLVARGERAQRMLHPVSELACDLVGNVERVLRHEEHADTLRSDQPHHLLDLVEQRVGRILEQQVRLVEEEDQLGLVEVAHLGQLFEQFGQQPQQEGRVQFGRRHQLVGGKDVDDAATLLVSRDQVGDRQRRLAEEMLGALRPQLQQRALDGADRLLRDIAIGRRQLRRPRRAVRQHRLEIVEVEQQQLLLVGDMKGDRQHALLHRGQVHQPREQQRPHLADRGADRVTLLAVQVPELHRIVGVAPIGIADRLGAVCERLVHLARR